MMEPDENAEGFTRQGSGCAHSNDSEMHVSRGELCPVDGAATGHAQMKITEFDWEWKLAYEHL